MTRRPRWLLSVSPGSPPALCPVSMPPEPPCYRLSPSSETPRYILCSSRAYIGAALLPPRASGRYL
ncbi:hypothetical protein C8Q73DRAFT_690294 [Cubamyces lactineus]|nr:hypothetical protein C8Q73DRAFT_690294 [Cubamyces lactineus]